MAVDTTLRVGFDDIVTHIVAFRSAAGVVSREDVVSRDVFVGNRFALGSVDMARMQDRCRGGLVDTPYHHHANVKDDGVWNTLRYMYFHMRCGIYVCIRNNRVVAFAPFVNPEYTNTWSHVIEVDPDYYERKSRVCRREAVLPLPKWWANAHIMCNEMPEKGKPMWGQFFVRDYLEMLERTCATRIVPDIEFFLNKRDHPQLKRDLTEPYDFVWDNKPPPLLNERHLKYAPIVSPYTSDKFSDVPWPLVADWLLNVNAHEKVSKSTADILDTIRHKDWLKRTETAFFRGSATGGGVTIQTNGRLALAFLDHVWSKDPKRHTLLDAKLTSYNLRDKKIAGSPMAFINPDSFSFKVDKSNFVSPQDQQRYKYVVYVAGHSAASRYSSLMVSGSVILKVEDGPHTSAPDLWFSPLLKPYKDHVPVKHDLSDLEHQIWWCRKREETCESIAENARLLAEHYLGREGIKDYCQWAMWEMKGCFVDG